jgi:hypothetical protein
MKTKATKKKAKKVEGVQVEVTGVLPPSKVRLELRLDVDVHSKLKDIAEHCGLSLNQVIEGICDVCGRYAVAGEPLKLGGDCVFTTMEKPRCVWFGVISSHGMSAKEWEAYVVEHESNPPLVTKGEVWFGLDYSERRIVRY